MLAEGGGKGDLLRVGELPTDIRYVIPLDADTQLPHGCARRLVETIAHPLNRVELTADGRDRVRGYTIIQPRVSITLPSATATRFTRLYTDARGTDPYSQAVSDVYQDLLGEAIYHGKAIYDVTAFDKILRGRFPEQRLLSQRFHADRRIKAVEPLLFERIPPVPSMLVHRQADYVGVARLATEPSRPEYRVFDEATPIPRVHLLGNGRYSLMVTNTGGGYSRWGEVEISRWRADTTRDNWGSFVYFHEEESDTLWSATHRPLMVKLRIERQTVAGAGAVTKARAPLDVSRFATIPAEG